MTPYEMTDAADNHQDRPRFASYSYALVSMAMKIKLLEVFA